jgi:hypothetical protein
VVTWLHCNEVFERSTISTTVRDWRQVAYKKKPGQRANKKGLQADRTIDFEAMRAVNNINQQTGSI